MVLMHRLIQRSTSIRLLTMEDGYNYGNAQMSIFIGKELGLEAEDLIMESLL